MRQSEAYHPSDKNTAHLIRLLGRKDLWVHTFLPGLAVLLALAARLIPGARTIDDAYITFRYAHNILSGLGFVYNPGEQVLGTTTPLFTLLLSGIGALLGGKEADFPQIAWVLNTLVDGITCYLLFFIGRKLGFLLAGLGAAFTWAVAPFSVTFAIGGLETSVYILLLVGTAACYLSEKYTWTAFFAALMLLTRPDALIYLGLLVLDRVLRWVKDFKDLKTAAQRAPSNRQLLAEILAFCLPVGAWFSFAIFYFGSPLPHSITAKTMAYHLEPMSALVRLLQHYATPFMEHLVFGSAWVLWGLLIYLFLAISGSLQAVRRIPSCWPFFAYPVFYFVTYALANPLIFRWYLSPPLPAYMLAILIGIEQVISGFSWVLEKRFPSRGMPQSRAVLVSLRLLTVLFVILAPVGFSLHAWTWQPDHGLDRPAPQMAWYQLELLYRQAAGILQEEIALHPQQPITLAAGDVGVLGYFTHAKILDTVGLISPQSTQYYPTDPDYYVINYAIPPALILDYQTEFIVILEV